MQTTPTMMDESGDLAVEFVDVSKVYHTYATPRHRLLELLSGGRRQYAREARALDAVSFSLPKGGRLGIVGENGSGKSTLLKILAGVLTPSAGSVRVNGRISALLELGAGFNPELPGRENIRQYCMLHGMRRAEIDEAIPDIVQFSELKDYIDNPVKTYSSGMAVRLGFSCAVYVKPEILIVDEALSVGDAYFQNKCLHKIKALLDGGSTFIYVTHAADSVRALCDTGLWMDHGKARLFGSSSEVGAAYQKEIFSRMIRAGLGDVASETPLSSTDMPSDGNEGGAPMVAGDLLRQQAFEDRVAPLRTGNGAARVKDIALVNQAGDDTDGLVFGEMCRVRVFYRIERELQHDARGHYALALGVTDTSGRQILHFSSAAQGMHLSSDELHTLHVMEFEFRNTLCPGEYGLVAGIGLLSEDVAANARSSVQEVVDHCVGGARFNVRPPDDVSGLDLWGVVHVPHTIARFSLS